MAIYLPRGPILANPEHDALNITTLRSALPCTVVQVNYRWSREHRFPTPLHDAILGYDWVKENLLAKRAISRPGRSEHVGRVAIAGEVLGGTLSTALALSECRIGEPGIVAAAINNPITDWPGLDDDEGNSSGESGGASHLNVESLAMHRKALFHRPDSYFDPFASPILFFRSAGVEASEPMPEAPQSDMELLAMLEREDFFRSQLALSAIPLSPDRQTATSMDSPKIVTKKRKTSRRFPSVLWRLRLPGFFLSAGRDTPMANQTTELARMLRKSFERQAKATNLARDQREDAVEHYETSGLGLWDESRVGRESIYQAAQWLKHTVFA